MRLTSLLTGAFFSLMLLSCSDFTSKETTALPIDSIIQNESINSEEDSVLAELFNTSEGLQSCGYNDGVYPASVQYVDLSSGLTKVQTIQVEVVECQVVNLLLKEVEGGKYPIRPSELDSAGRTPILEGPGGILYDEVKVLKK